MPVSTYINNWNKVFCTDYQVVTKSILLYIGENQRKNKFLFQYEFYLNSEYYYIEVKDKNTLNVVLYSSAFEYNSYDLYLKLVGITTIPFHICLRNKRFFVTLSGY